MTNLFKDVPEEIVNRTLKEICRNLEYISIYDGHTLQKHADIQCLILKTRLTSEDIQYATSYHDIAIANLVVKSILKYQFDSVIREWLLSTCTDILALSGRFQRSIGYGYKKDVDSLFENLNKAKLVLMKDNRADWGFKILTSYPAF